MAKYASLESRCGLCDNDIAEGDEIKKCDDEWCHAECVDEEDGVLPVVTS